MSAASASVVVVVGSQGRNGPTGGAHAASQIGLEVALEDFVARLPGHLVEAAAVAADGRPSSTQLWLASRIDEHVVDESHGVVAGGAVDRPVRGQAFAGREDLLDADPAGGQITSETLEVAARLCQAVDVVDPDPGDHPLLEPAAGQFVHQLRGGLVLHAQRDEVVDGEEAAHVAEAASPSHQAVVLRIEELGQLESPRFRARAAAAAIRP